MSFHCGRVSLQIVLIALSPIPVGDKFNLANYHTRCDVFFIHKFVSICSIAFPI